MEMYENKQEKEKALLVSVDTGEFDAEVSIDELEELAHTAGAEVLGKLIQKGKDPKPPPLSAPESLRKSLRSALLRTWIC